MTMLLIRNKSYYTFIGEPVLRLVRRRPLITWGLAYLMILCVSDQQQR
jgi:hypothetical protein